MRRAAGDMGSGCTLSGRGVDVLSTQSTSDPEVVNGMRESIAFVGTLCKRTGGFDVQCE